MIAEVVRAIHAKWEATTPRERAGIALLAAVLFLTAAVYAMDWAGGAARSAEVATQRSADASAVLSSLQDGAYRQHLQDDAGRIWRWSRSGDAFAGEETLAELESLCAEVGIGDAELALVEQTPSDGQVGVIEASISASFNWGTFIALLNALGEADLSIDVRSIDVTDDEGAQRMTLVVGVPIINVVETR